MARPAVSGQNNPERGHQLVLQLEWDDYHRQQRGRSTNEEQANHSTHK